MTIKFIKKFLVTAGLSSLWIFSAGLANASSMEDAVNATFKLYAGEASENHSASDGICSTTYIGQNKKGEDLFLTAAHCVEVDGDQNYNVRLLSWDEDYEKVVASKTYYLDLIRRIKSEDVALLKVRGNGLGEDAPVAADIATPEEYKPVIGDPVMVLGFPRALEKTVTKGEWTAFTPGILEVDGPLQRTTAPVKGGSSGGGLWYEFKPGGFKLVGTTFAMFRDSEFINYFTTPEKIKDLLKVTELSGKNVIEPSPARGGENNAGFKKAD